MMGHLNLGRKPGYHFYGVAIQKNGTLFLTLWIKCDSEGHIYVLYRRPDGEWNPHASYHKDGKYHNKSHGQVSVEKKLQHLNANFRGSETMGLFTGHGTSMGALCEPADYDGVVIVDPSVLGPRHGAVSVDIIQPGFEDAWKSEVAPKFYPDGAHSCTIFKRGNHPSLAITIVQ